MHLSPILLSHSTSRFLLFSFLYCYDDVSVSCFEVLFVSLHISPLISFSFFFSPCFFLYLFFVLSFIFCLRVSFYLCAFVCLAIFLCLSVSVPITCVCLTCPSQSVFLYLLLSHSLSLSLFLSLLRSLSLSLSYSLPHPLSLSLSLARSFFTCSTDFSRLHKKNIKLTTTIKSTNKKATSSIKGGETSGNQMIPACNISLASRVCLPFRLNLPCREWTRNEGSVVSSAGRLIKY